MDANKPKGNVSRLRAYVGANFWRSSDAARFFNISPTKFSKIMNGHEEIPHGILNELNLKPEPATKKKRIPKHSERNSRIVEMFKSGKTLKEIGKGYGITRERVRQVLFEFGITGKDGGQALAVRERKVKFKAEQDRKYLKRTGYTYREYRRINDDPKNRYNGYYGYPSAAYTQQRNNAYDRKIGWEFSNFREWWEVWEKSGKWPLRGRGYGYYVMARINDKGPYRADNVKIIQAVENNQEQYVNRGITVSIDPIKLEVAALMSIGHRQRLLRQEV